MSEILNKKALVEVVAEKLEMTKKDATVAVDTVFEEITKTLADGGKVDLSGFGKFDPATKEPLPIAASKAPKFKAAKALKDAVK